MPPFPPLLVTKPVVHAEILYQDPP